MKKLIASFILTFTGSVLLCVSFVLAVEPAKTEKHIEETVLFATERTEASTTTLSLPEEGKASEDAWVAAVATAYCPCEKCCGIWAENRPNGVVYTASGAIAEEGVTIAADWSVYPPGTVILVEGLGEYIVQDRGGAITGQKIDVYFENHEDALRFGRQEVKIKIIER